MNVTNPSKYDATLKLTIDRSQYNMPNLTKVYQMNTMPAHTYTSVTPKVDYYTYQIANYSLDEILNFNGHVLSTILLQNGQPATTPKVSLSQRVISYYSALPPPPSQAKLFDSNVKFNRIFKLEDRMVALANDTYNSYLIFYSDFYTQDGGNYTIPNTLCQNLDADIAQDYIFIVLQCNNYNVFSVVYFLLENKDSPDKISYTKRVVTDEVTLVGVGLVGSDTFMVGVNMVTGLEFTVADVYFDSDFGFSVSYRKIQTLPPCKA